MARTISTFTLGPVTLSTADDPLTITSTGTVMSTGSGFDGIDGGTGTTWTISNAGVVSSSGGYGISLASAGIISNSGSISGVDGVVLHHGGSVTNAAGGSISGSGAIGHGGGSGSGVYITGAAGTLSNNGSISGAAYGVGLGAGGMVTNTASIKGAEDGVIVQGGIGTVSNSGTITATVDDCVALFSGGSVTNAIGGLISATDTVGSSVFITGGQGLVSNNGAIATPPSATNGTSLIDSYPTAMASSSAPKLNASEIDPSIAGRGERSVGTCTSRFLNMAFVRR